MIEVFLSVIFLILTIIYHVTTRKFGYWRKKKIPYLKPVPILGNYGALLLQKKFSGLTVQDLCRKFPDKQYFGAFYGTEPILIVSSPEMIRTITTKDFYYFSNREISRHTHKEVVTQNLFFTYGDRWKVLRQNLTPIFTSAKMKNMFYLVNKCAHIFEEMLDRELKNDNVQEVRPLVSRFTMDVIGNCSFGIDTATMAQDTKNNPFINIGNQIFSQNWYRGFKIVFRAIWPGIFYGAGFTTFPREAGDFFTKLLKGVFEERQYKPTNRNDFVDHILNWNTEKYITGDSMNNLKGTDEKVTLEVDDELLAGQCFLFFAAGYETSATVIHYTLYELAKHPEIQQRAIDEIDEYLLRHNNKLEYECTTELPFTEACMDEALRFYPVLGAIAREVVEDYTLPCGAVIDKGTRVHIPLYYFHHNPDFFPDPEEFRPDRFYGEGKQNIIPYTYMPFGVGPRICIGTRFAKMQMFPAIVTVLKKYRVELAEGTPRKLEFTPTTLITQPTSLVRLKFIERQGWQRRQYIHT